MKTSTSNLNESIQSIQNNSRNSEINSLEVIQAANFPPLNNSFSNLSEPMEVVNSYRYSMDDLRRTYSDAMASPSPTRKKSKHSSDDSFPSAQWIEKNIGVTGVPETTHTLGPKNANSSPSKLTQSASSLSLSSFSRTNIMDKNSLSAATAPSTQSSSPSRTQHSNPSSHNAIPLQESNKSHQKP